jgi:hypothetical protein
LEGHDKAGISVNKSCTDVTNNFFSLTRFDALHSLFMLLCLFKKESYKKTITKDHLLAVSLPVHY